MQLSASVRIHLSAASLGPVEASSALFLCELTVAGVVVGNVHIFVDHVVVFFEVRNPPPQGHLHKQLGGLPSQDVRILKLHQPESEWHPDSQFFAKDGKDELGPPAVLGTIDHVGDLLILEKHDAFIGFPENQFDEPSEQVHLFLLPLDCEALGQKDPQDTVDADQHGSEEGVEEIGNHYLMCPSCRSAS